MPKSLVALLAVTLSTLALACGTAAQVDPPKAPDAPETPSSDTPSSDTPTVDDPSPGVPTDPTRVLDGEKPAPPSSPQ